MFFLLDHKGRGHLSGLSVQCHNLFVHLLADGFAVGGLGALLFF